jgi:hypothetical protein
LPADGLVSTGLELREQVRDFFAGLARNQEERSQFRFDDFLEGLKTLRRFSNRALCTGHGVVLAGDIRAGLFHHSADGVHPGCPAPSQTGDVTIGNPDNGESRLVKGGSAGLRYLHSRRASKLFGSSPSFAVLRYLRLFRLATITITFADPMPKW